MTKLRDCLKEDPHNGRGTASETSSVLGNCLLVVLPLLLAVTGEDYYYRKPRPQALRNLHHPHPVARRLDATDTPPSRPSPEARPPPPLGQALSSQPLPATDSPHSASVRNEAFRSHPSLSTPFRPRLPCGRPGRTPAAGPRRLPGRALPLRLSPTRDRLRHGLAPARRAHN